MNKYLEILTGLILLLVPIYTWMAIPGGYWELGTAALMVLKGGLMWALLGIGAMFLIIGLSDLKD